MKVIQTRGRGKSLPRNTTMTPPTVIQTQDQRRRPPKSAMIATIVTRIQDPRGNLQRSITTRVTRILGPQKDIQGNVTMRVTPIQDPKGCLRENMMRAIRIIRPGKSPLRNTIVTATLTTSLRRNRPSNAMIGVILAQARARRRERANIKANRLTKASTWRLRHQSTSENATAATHRRNTMKDQRNRNDI